MPLSRLKKSTLRVLSVLAVLLLASAVYAWYFGAATVNVLEARYTGMQMPELKETPVPIRDLSLSQVRSAKVSFCDYEFGVPWNDADDSKTKVYPTRRVLYFNSGIVLMVSCGSPNDLVNTVRSKFKWSSDDLRLVVGERASQSDYAFTQLMLGTTPDQIKFSTRPQDAARMQWLLLIKAMATPATGPGIFSIRTEAFEGFQYGDPAARPKHLVVDLYGPEQGLEFSFFQKGEGALPRVTQGDINAILHSIRKMRIQNLTKGARP